jgi:hypothetical protein
MKMSLRWHKDCLENMRRGAGEKERQAISAREDANKAWRDIAALERQIAAAEKQGKDGFDDEKFMVAKNNR